MSFAYKLIIDEQQFYQLQDEWQILLQASECCTIFLNWSWQWQWWKQFSGDLFIIVVEAPENAEILAIFPFIRHHKPGFYELALIGSPDSDYLDIIIKSGHETDILNYFFQIFLVQHPRIGAVALDSIPQNSPNRPYLEALDKKQFSLKTSQKPCPYIALPDSWEAYQASLSKSMRQYIARKTRKLEKTYAVSIGVADLNDCDIRFEQFVQQHQQVWRQRQKPGAFHRAHFLQFQREMTPLLIQNQQLRLIYLELDGKPAASYYLFFNDNQYFYYLSGFDLAYAAFSPSVVLLGKTIKLAIEEGCQRFDLMRGSGAYKYKWTQTQQMNQTWLIKKRRAWVIAYYQWDDLVQICTLFLKKIIPPTIKNGLKACLPSKVFD